MLWVLPKHGSLKVTLKQTHVGQYTILHVRTKIQKYFVLSVG